MTMPEPDRELRSPKREPRSVFLAMVAAMSLPGAVIGGVAIGWWIDQGQGTSPWWAASLGGAGLLAGLYQLIRGSQG
ncbi:hypothetical protein LBMAG53_04670 [Planctomycetota bacterium]|nr:hypothetical protein LBMAG53_04670 [Planctomycetota bacterium]